MLEDTGDYKVADLVRGAVVRRRLHHRRRHHCRLDDGFSGFEFLGVWYNIVIRSDIECYQVFDGGERNADSC